MTVPNKLSDIATFASSNTTALLISDNTQVHSIIFNPTASVFLINIRPGFRLEISGVGLTNNSGSVQNFVTAADVDQSSIIFFENSSTAGSLTAFTNRGGAGRFGGGFTQFSGTSTAGDGTFTNNGGEVEGLEQPTFNGGLTIFIQNSSAGNSTLIANGASVNGAGGGRTDFSDDSTAGNAMVTANGATSSGTQSGGAIFELSSTAGNAMVTANGGTVRGAVGGFTSFGNTASAGNATLIANGGQNGGKGGGIYFDDRFSHFPHDAPSGGTARVELFGNGRLDLSGLTLTSLGVTIGSIEGDGLIFLGSNNLTVGSNNLSTDFSGVIHDGGAFSTRTGGSLTKIGKGKLVLEHRNNYTGGTSIKRGHLQVNNLGGSGTGSGPVQVKAGSLGGKGIIEGAVTVGTGSGRGATLSPGYLHGVGRPGALTIQSSLTFNSDGIYQMELNSSNVTADEVVANGVTLNAGTQFSFLDFGSASLPPGTVFTAINNTAASPIAGAFVNLPDGSTLTSNGSTYQANYEGGDGNDLTLTVVP